MTGRTNASEGESDEIRRKLHHTRRQVFGVRVLSEHQNKTHRSFRALEVKSQFHKRSAGSPEPKQERQYRAHQKGTEGKACRLECLL